MPELIDKKRTEAKVFLIARFFIDRPDREVELVRAVIHRCCEEIDKQPTIESEPVRHGRWIPEPGEPDWYRCSCCMKNTIYSTDKQDMETFEAFCSRCGARMDGGADNG